MSQDAGWVIRLPEIPPALSFAATLPADSLFAGWPGDMERIPYVSARAVLVNHETHIAYHRDYLMEMRRRTIAFIEAY